MRRLASRPRATEKNRPNRPRSSSQKRDHCGHQAATPLDSDFAGILIDRPAGGLTGINAFGAML
jgi:hypothetical protein